MSDLQTLAEEHASPVEGKLGRLPSTHQPKLHLADYLEAQAQPVPQSVHRSHYGFGWGMLGNDQVGDCVIAAMLHSIVAWQLAAGARPSVFTDQQAIDLYSKIAGYNPADPSTDQGTDPAAAFTYWERTGVPTAAGTDVLPGTIAVNPKDDVQVHVAINELVVASMGLSLPVSAQGQRVWDVTDPSLTGDAEPGSWGGHEIIEVSYDQRFDGVITWGAPKLLTRAFRHAYCDQLNAHLSRDLMSKGGVSPTGLNWDRLKADWQKL